MEDRKLGVKLARHAQGLLEITEKVYVDAQETNGITVVLPDDFDGCQINQLLFGFNLANYKWHFKSVKATKVNSLKS